MHPPAEHLNFYATPELAVHYDADHTARDDFAFYLRLARELGAARVIDIGCGTGALCSRLAAEGCQVVGVDPQSTMLDLAQRQPNASAVRWIHGTADDLPSDWADLVVMTGHVAQYFLTDDDWERVLREARRALRSSGHLAFEVRNDSVEAWRAWANESPRETAAGTITTTVDVEGDLVTHISYWVQGDREWSTSETLRFPSWETLKAGLDHAGFAITEVWGDFAGRPVHPRSPEWVVLARPTSSDQR